MAEVFGQGLASLNVDERGRVVRPGEAWLAKDAPAPPATPLQGGAGAGSVLPCLNTNNSTGADPQKWNKLTPGHKKTAFALVENIKRLSDKYGIERIAFFTLTFADFVLCMREASRRYDSLNTHVLAKRYAETITIPERMKSGRVHFHCLVVVPSDIRTGFDFDQAENGVYSSANEFLRSEWSFWRKNAKKYGFGRTEMLPVKSTGEGVAKYLGKYIAKQIGGRQERDKGVRLVRYARGASFNSTRFQFASIRSKLWRHQVGLFAAKNHCADLEQLQAKFGKQVLYFKRDEIRRMVPTCPELRDVFDQDRHAWSVEVANATGCTQAEAWIYFFGQVEAAPIANEFPEYNPPPMPPALDGCKFVEQTTVLADGTAWREKVWVGAGGESPPDRPEAVAFAD